MKNSIEKIVSQGPAHGVPCEEAAQSIFWPADLALEDFEVEGFGMEKGRSWASRDVVADKVHNVEKNWQTEHDAGGANTKKTDWLAAVWFAMLAHRASDKTGESTYGPPNS